MHLKCDGVAGGPETPTPEPVVWQLAFKEVTRRVKVILRRAARRSSKILRITHGQMDRVFWHNLQCFNLGCSNKLSLTRHTTSQHQIIFSSYARGWSHKTDKPDYSGGFPRD